MAATPLRHNANFRLVLSATAVSNLGDGVLAVAIPWFASLLTRDPFLIGVVAMARMLPWLVFGLPAGVITDHFDRKRLILGADATRLILILATAALAAFAGAAPLAVYGLAAMAFVIGSAEVLRDNTAQSILPAIVATDQLERANGLIWSAEQLTGQFIGPPLAGALIAAAIALPFGFDAAMLALSIGLMARISLPRRIAAPRPPFLPALREGLRYLRDHASLRRLAFVLACFNFLYYLAAAVLVLYAQDVLGLSAAGFGALLSAQAVGGLASSLAGPSIIRRIGPNRSLIAGMVGFIALSAAMALTSTLWLIAGLMIVDGFTGMIWNIATVSYRQRTIPAALFGRVNAAYRFFGSGAAPLGALAGGAIATLAAPLGENALHLPYAFAALGATAMLVYAALRLRLE